MDALQFLTVFFLTYFLLSIVWVVLCVHIAGKKGQDKVLWGVLGLFLGLIAVIALLVCGDIEEGEKRKEKERNKKDPAEQIRKYKELLDNGAITQEEYEKKKEEFLKEE